jgi:ribosomal protein S18 acetylase RimI-like enzyme
MIPIIRKISVNDAEALAKLSRITFFDTFTGTCTEKDMEDFLEQTFNLPQLQLELADEANLYYFAELAGEPVAYLQMKEDYSGLELITKWKALELKRIYIDKAFHGQGLAQQLMQFVENYARENNYQVVWLGVWEHNLRAKKFYEKSGFEDTGVVHDFPIGNTPQTDNYLWKFLN